METTKAIGADGKSGHLQSSGGAILGQKLLEYSYVL